MGAQYYSREDLVLNPDIAGAKMWGVALDKTQLTYFEVEPNCTFEKHSHKSEQITMVLSGKLYFELENKTICVNEGEVIAIPSNVRHGVYTEEESVKAVDAWSPVMSKYKQSQVQ